MSSTQMLPYDAITEILSHRNQALDLYRQFFELLHQAHDLRERAESAVQQAQAGFSPAYSYSVDPSTRELLSYFDTTKRPASTDELLCVATRLADLSIWGSIVRRSRLLELMDRQSCEELRAQFKYKPQYRDPDKNQLQNRSDLQDTLPPLNRENIEATLRGFMENAEEIWCRGVANVFSKLDRRFRSHDGFKIGSRIILGWAVEGRWIRRDFKAKISDVERVFRMLDGKPVLGSSEESSFVDRMTEERKDYRKQSVHEGDYFRVKLFANGNGHIWFKRDDLVERVNQLLADYYGPVLGWGTPTGAATQAPSPGSLERPLGPCEIVSTPSCLAKRVLDQASLPSDESLTILDPCAGTGVLSGMAVTAGSDDDKPASSKHRVTAVEIQPDLAAGLRASTSYDQVLQIDFLKLEPSSVARFDRVVMHPPFASGLDIELVLHALKFLKPGGRLVAIMSAAGEFESTPTAAALKKEVKFHRGMWRDLPPGSLKEVGTNVNTRLLMLSKNLY